ncbi:hypothetical protein TNCV_4744411 [Trichonephila clavipes]|nr:hypothetical protein TNCV_4744411 [Trichonephila clavipes]
MPWPSWAVAPLRLVYQILMFQPVYREDFREEMKLLSKDVNKNFWFLARAVSVACFRLTTGHDFLQAYLYRVGMAEIQTLTHFVTMSRYHLNICLTVLNCISLNVAHCAFDDCFYRSTLYWAAR